MKNDVIYKSVEKELIEIYRANSDTINKESSGYLNKFRDKAFKDFQKLGIPDQKNEVYKYTNIGQYLKGDHTYDLAPSNYDLNYDDLFKCEVPELDTFLVLIFNGFYYKRNVLSNLPEGIIITSLAEASINYPDIVNKHYSKYADTSLDSLAALNTLFAQDGLFIYIPGGIILDKPIQVVNIGFSLKNLRITRRNLIVCDENSYANILICDHTLCNKSFITNSLTEIYAGKNAVLDYTKIQNENNKSVQISNTFIHQESAGNVSMNTISLHGGLIRNNILVRLNGENADNNIYGLFMADQEQHIANYTHIHHAVPNCTSDQLVKGILDDNSTGVFNGKILVGKDAQKTLAYQRNNNILLSKDARMNSKPQLEIYADDVKCSHGATDGQIDENALFYIRSRGIPEKEATHLLMYAFANEVIGKIKLPVLRERIIEMVDKRIRGELARCNHCNIRCHE